MKNSKSAQSVSQVNHQDTNHISGASINNTDQKKSLLSIQGLERVPSELKEINHWIRWRYGTAIEKNGKKRKIPIGKDGSSKGWQFDHQHLTFDEAVQKTKNSADMGIGLVLPARATLTRGWRKATQRGCCVSKAASPETKSLGPRRFAQSKQACSFLKSRASNGRNPESGALRQTKRLFFSRLGCR